MPDQLLRHSGKPCPGGLPLPASESQTDFAKVSLGLPAYFSGHATLSLGPAHDPRSHKAGKWLSTCKG